MFIGNFQRRRRRRNKGFWNQKQKFLKEHNSMIRLDWDCQIRGVGNMFQTKILQSVREDVILDIFCNNMTEIDRIYEMKTFKLKLIQQN